VASSGSRELKLRLALEYDPTGYGQFLSDVASVQAAATESSGSLEAMAVSLNALGSAAGSLAPLDASLQQAAAGLAGVSQEASATQAGLSEIGGGSASVELAAIGEAGAAAAAGMGGVGTSATAAAGATEQMTVAQARAAVALAAQAEAAKRVSAAETELVAAVQRHGAGSAEAAQATEVLTKAQREQAEAAKDVALATEQSAAGLGEFSDRTKAVATGITAIVSALGVATSAASEYNQAITNVSTLGAEAETHFDEFHAGILDVSTALGQDATTAATGLYNALSAGVPADNAISFMETAGKAAVAGVSDINTAVGALSVGVNAFNLDASETERVSDALFTTVKLGVTNFGELGSAFGGVAGIAASSGASIEETLASLAQITTKGFSTSQAVTGLKAAFVSLSSPMVDAALKARGFADGADAVKQIGLQGVFEAIRAEAEATGTPLIKMVGSSEALNAILSTTGENSESARAKLAEFGNTAGATAAAFQLIDETPAQRMKVFQASVQAATISLGDAFLPVLGGMLDALTPLIQGFTRFAQGVLVPLGGLFNELPGPIRFTVAALALLVAGGASLITAYTLAQPVLASMLPTLFGTGAAAATAGAASAGAAGGVGLLSAAASTLWAALGPLLPIIGAVVAVMSLVSVASDRADEALQAQFATLDKGQDGFDKYAQAAQRAREQSGLLAGLGFQWRDGLRDAGDDWLIFKDKASSALTSVGSALSGAGSSVASFLGIGDGVGKVADEAERLKPSAGAILDAGQAFLEMGTNIDPAVQESEKFRLAQARLNEQVRDGSLKQNDYQKALLSVANAVSLSEGKGAVLTNLQVKTRDAFLASSRAVAEHGGVLSKSTLASEGFAAKQQELATAVAKGALNGEQAKAQWQAYVDQLAAGDTEAQKAIKANAALASGFEDLKAGLGAGSLSLDDARARLQELGTQAGATSEQLDAMAQDLEGLAVPEGFAELGFELNTEALLDPEKMAEELEAGRAQLADSVAGIFQDQIEGRRKFQMEEAALAAERPEAIAKAEADVAARIAEVQAKGGDKVGERVAELQAGLAKEVEAINTGNAEKLSALRAGYAQETQERRDALAQAALDQVNSLLSLGKISEDQAFRIFGSLKEASPGSHLFSEEAAATIKFNSTLGQATQGSVEAADALGGMLLNIEGEAEASVAAVEAREQRGIAAVQATDAQVQLSTGIRADAYLSQAAAVENAALVESGSNQARIDSSLSTDAVLQASTDARVNMRSVEAAASADATNLLLSDDERAAASVQVAAGQVETEHQRMILARQDSAAASRQSTDGMVQDTARLSKGAQDAGAAVSQNVGRIGGDFIQSGKGVRVGTGEIIEATADAKVALAGIGTGVPGSLAPAAEAIKALGNEAAITGTRIAEAAHTRTEGEEDAASKTVSAADETVSGFKRVNEQSVETAAGVAGLQKELKALPTKIDIPLTVTGTDKARAAVAQLAKDLQAATGVWTLRIDASYNPKSPAMNPGESIRLQHDIEDAIAAAAPGVHLSGQYAGAGAMAWTPRGLALTQSVDAAAGRGIPSLLLFDPAADAAKLRPYLDEISRAAAALAELKAEAVDADGVLRPALEGIQAALDNFFTTDPAAGGLAAILDQLSKLGISLGENFFRDAGILDVANFEELRQQLASLADDPKRQEDLWKTFIDALTNRWKVYYEEQSNQLERQKRAQEALRREALKANKDADTSAFDAKIEQLDEQLRSLKDQNEDVNLILKDQTFNVGAQFDLYGRLLGAVEGRAKAEDDAAKAVERAVKAAADAIKGLQAEARGAEDDAHEQTMVLLEQEQKARERAYKDELARLDALAAATKADVAAQLKAEDEAHQKRLSDITAQADADQSALDQKLSDLDRAKSIIDSFSKGNAATDEQKDFLRSIGLDPAQLIKAEEEIAKTTEQVDALKTLLGRLDKTSSKRITKDQINEAERAALEKLKADPNLTDKERRRVDVALNSKGGISQKQLAALLERATGDGGDGGAPGFLEAQVAAQKESVAVQQAGLDLLNAEIEKRQAAAKDQQAVLDREKAALQGAIADENKRHDNAVAFQQTRLDGIDAERDALKQRYDDEKEAIAAAKDAEEERHKARLRQIDEEYALQLLRLGKTDAEVQDELDKQKKRAAAIADEAQKRFEAILADARVRRAQEEADRKKREDEAAAKAAANSGSNVTRPEEPPVQAPPQEPRNPVVPPPGPPPGQNDSAIQSDAIPFENVFSGFTNPNASIEKIVSGQLDSLRAAAATAGLDMSTSLSSGFTNPNTSIEKIVSGQLDGMRSAAAETGLVMATRLFDPALVQLDQLVERTRSLRDIFTGTPGLFGLAGGGDVAVDRRIVFNGPVTLDHELAEELGILDVARTGAP